jgi:hypothetical protein
MLSFIVVIPVCEKENANSHHKMRRKGYRFNKRGKDDERSGSSQLRFQNREQIRSEFCGKLRIGFGLVQFYRLTDAVVIGVAIGTLLHVSAHKFAFFRTNTLAGLLADLL